MINNLIDKFNNNWPYKDNDINDYLVEDAGTCYRIIIRNTCEWYHKSGGCTMCNYSDHSGETASTTIIKHSDSIIQQLLNLKKNYQKIKFYIDGSFFNENELQESIAIDFLCRLNGIGITSVCVETRPEYITREKLKRYISNTQLEFEVCFGLESVDDLIRNQCLHKGINYQSFLKTYASIKDLCTVKVYLLIKPPFISEKNAIEDVINSVNKLLHEGITNISYTPIAVQNNTLLEFLLQENLYRPVWIWSIIEINSRLKRVRADNPGIHLGGLDYYPEPLVHTYNCEHCSSILYHQLLNNRNLTWDDIVPSFKCQCYNTWRKLIEFEKEESISEQISRATVAFDHVLNRSKAISNSFEVDNNRILTDVAKSVPNYKCVIDKVGVNNLKIPFCFADYHTSFADCDYSIELDSFHRGIHMSRLVEHLNMFSLSKHTDILEDIENTLVFPDISTYFKIRFHVMTVIKNKLTKKENYIDFAIVCSVTNSHRRTERCFSISIPFINACPCTKLTVEELFGLTYSHTQRGKITVTFINPTITLEDIIDYLKSYVSIFDLLKREDEIYVVSTAYNDSKFCEDICREISMGIYNKYYNLADEAIVEVVTEESIHPHNAYAEKRVILKGIFC